MFILLSVLTIPLTPYWYTQNCHKKTPLLENLKSASSNSSEEAGEASPSTGYTDAPTIAKLNLQPTSLYNGNPYYSQIKYSINSLEANYNNTTMLEF